MNLQIDPEFKKLIEPLRNEEYEGLEKNIIANGCLDSIKVWLDNIIIDGHNRYEICQKHDIPFETKQMEFPSRSHAKIWILDNQFGRRNISAWQRGQMALEYKDIISDMARENQALAGGDKKSEEYKSLPQNSDEPIAPIDTNEELAKKVGLSHDTIARVERIKSEGTPEQIERLDSKEASINEVYNEIKNGNLCERAIELLKGTPYEGRKSWLAEIAKIRDERRQVTWVQMILGNPLWSLDMTKKKIMAEEYGFTINNYNRIILPQSTLHTYKNSLPKEKQKEIIKDVLEGKYPPFTEMEVCLVNRDQDDLVYDVKIEMGLIKLPKPPKEKPKDDDPIEVEDDRIEGSWDDEEEPDEVEEITETGNSSKITKLQKGIEYLKRGFEVVCADLNEHEAVQLDSIISALSYKANHYDMVEAYEKSEEA